MATRRGRQPPTIVSISSKVISADLPDSVSSCRRRALCFDTGAYVCAVVDPDSPEAVDVGLKCSSERLEIAEQEDTVRVPLVRPVHGRYLVQIQRDA